MGSATVSQDVVLALLATQAPRLPPSKPLSCRGLLRCRVHRSQAGVRNLCCSLSNTHLHVISHDDDLLALVVGRVVGCATGGLGRQGVLPVVWLGGYSNATYAPNRCTASSWSGGLAAPYSSAGCPVSRWPLGPQLVVKGQSRAVASAYAYSLSPHGGPDQSRHHEHRSSAHSFRRPGGAGTGRVAATRCATRRSDDRDLRGCAARHVFAAAGDRALLGEAGGLGRQSPPGGPAWRCSDAAAE